MFEIGDRVEYKEKEIVGHVVGFYKHLDRVEIKTATGNYWLVRREDLVKKHK